MKKIRTINLTKAYFFVGTSVICMLCLLSLWYGAVFIQPMEFLKAFLGGGDDAYRIIIYSVRLPETAAAVVCGAGLGASGLLLQRLTDNKMASPGLIGVSHGAGFGVMLLLYFFPKFYRFSPFAAFFGSLLSTIFIALLSHRTGFTKNGVVLVGLALSSTLSAGISFISMLDSQALVNYNAFSVGSLSSVTMSELVLPSVMIGGCCFAAVLLSKKCDILLLGDELAISLGLSPKKLRFALMLLASAAGGAVVSFAGLVGFVGLMSPHIARIFVPEKMKILLPASVVSGVCLVLAAQLLSRVILAPSSVPVGIILSVFGAPFFLFLLLRKGGSGNA